MEKEKVKRLYFEINENDCFTPCKIHTQKIGIGSLTCQNCEYHKGISFDELWVDCTRSFDKPKKCIKFKGTTINFKEDTGKEIETMLGLLRQVYDAFEMNHLTDSKMVVDYVDTGNIDFKKSLGKRIFGYLQAKDQTFRNKVIKRQNRWRRKQKSNQ